MRSNKQSTANTESESSLQHTTVPASAVSESISAHSESVSSKNMDNVARVSEDTDRNSSSPSKTADPARKKTFKIISMKKGGSGDVPVDNDADSMDGLDESQTEDLSSEFYDSSKATDIDQEFQDNLIPLTPDEVTTVVIKQQKPDRDSQSRFKVVKIETKEPFRRGKWICYDFFDAVPAVTEKIVTKVPDDSHLHSDMSNSTSSSVQLVHNMKDSSSNIIVPLASGIDGKTPLTEMFVPIEPAPSSLILIHTDSSSKDNIAPFTPQQPILDATGVLTSSSSFQNIIHQQGQGQTTLVQSLPQTNVFPYTQNAPGSIYQVGQTGQAVKANHDSSSLNFTGSQAGNQSLDTNYSTPHDNSSMVTQNSGFLQPGVSSIPHSQSQGQLSQGNTPQTQQMVQTGGVVDSSQNMASVGGNIATSGVQGITPSSVLTGSIVNNSSMQDIVGSSVHNTNSGMSSSMIGVDASALVGVAMDESTGSTKTIQNDMTSQLPSGGFEEAMVIDLDANPEEEMDEKVRQWALNACGGNESSFRRPSNFMESLDASSYIVSHTPMGSLSPSPIMFHHQDSTYPPCPQGKVISPSSSSGYIDGLVEPQPIPISGFLPTSYYFPFPNSQGGIFTPTHGGYPTPAPGYTPDPPSRANLPRLQAPSAGTATTVMSPHCPPDVNSLPTPIALDALSGMVAQIPGFSMEVSPSVALPQMQVLPSVSSSFSAVVPLGHECESPRSGFSEANDRRMGNSWSRDDDANNKATTRHAESQWDEQVSIESTDSEGYVSVRHHSVIAALCTPDVSSLSLTSKYHPFAVS